MAFARRAGGRPEANTWPGFVDALTALLLILMFVLSIFMIVQFTMSETITGQSKEIEQLNRQLAGLADELALERGRAEALEGEVGSLRATLAEERQEIDRLNAAMAALARSREAAEARVSELEGQLAESVSAREALEAAVASARSELDAAAEAARLAAARREALEALVAALEAKDRERTEEMAQVSAERARALALIEQLRSQTEQRIGELQSKLTAEEEARLAEMAAAEALRKRLAESDAELDAMTLALEEARKEAEDTLTLLAAARAANQELEGRLANRAGEVDREEALRRLAESELAQAKQQTLEEQRRVALLNAQLRELREQLGSLQALLEDYEQRDAESQVQIAELGERLNRALAQRVSELSRYQSVFFQKMDEVLGGREDIRRVGDRFVFQSEVLFAPGSADLGPEGQAELGKLGAVLREVAGAIPPEVGWILRVDGHTDKTPIRAGRYRDNWELSQARALSVVRYLIEQEGVAPERLAAAGFGEFQPVAEGETPEELARNRRIEFKFTER